MSEIASHCGDHDLCQNPAWHTCLCKCSLCAPVVADTKLEEAVREAHHCRANLILTHIEPPEKAHAENVALQKAIDRIAPLARLEGRLEEANIMLGIAVKYSGGPYPEMDTERDRLRAEVKRG